MIIRIVLSFPIFDTAQSLISRLKTGGIPGGMPKPPQFQSLIGRLKTILFDEFSHSLL